LLEFKELTILIWLSTLVEEVDAIVGEILELSDHILAFFIFSLSA
jgi:hypothetical protein